MIIMDEMVKRIKENRINPNLTYEYAKKYILNCLNSDLEEVSPEKNEGILESLRVIIACEFGLHQNQIVYNVANSHPRTTNASIQTSRGDGYYYLTVEKQYLYSAKTIYFLRSVLHEYGHLKLYFDLMNGKIVPNPVCSNEEKYRYANDWQRHGAGARYLSDDNEYLANCFAYAKMLEWIREIKKSADCKLIHKNKRIIKKEKSKERKSHTINKIEYKLWKLFNVILGIEDKKIVTDGDFSNHTTTTLWQINKKIPMPVNAETVENAKRNLMSMVIYKDQDFKTGNFDYKAYRIFVATNYLKIITARKLGITAEEIGFFWGEDGEISVINARKYNKNSKLQAYVVCSKERIGTYDSLEDYIEEVKPKLDLLVDEVKNLRELGVENE